MRMGRLPRVVNQTLMGPLFLQNGICGDGQVFFRRKEGFGRGAQQLLNEELRILPVQEVSAAFHEIPEQETEHVVSIQDGSRPGTLIQLAEPLPERRV